MVAGELNINSIILYYIIAHRNKINVRAVCSCTGSQVACRLKNCSFRWLVMCDDFHKSTNNLYLQSIPFVWNFNLFLKECTNNLGLVTKSASLANFVQIYNILRLMAVDMKLLLIVFINLSLSCTPLFEILFFKIQKFMPSKIHALICTTINDSIWQECKIRSM